MSILSDLRQSTNETARVARGNLLLFMVVGLFIALLVAATDDLLLLKRARIDLPLMEIGVTIDHFYGGAPIILVLLHMNLFLRLNRLAHVARFLQEEIEKLETPEQKTNQTALLFPFDFLQVLFYKTGRHVTGERPPHLQVRRHLQYEHEKFGYFHGLLLFVAIQIFVLPVLLLLWIQVRFLPYQSEAITFIHQVFILIDLAMQLFFLIRLGFFKKLFAVIFTDPSWVEVGLKTLHFAFISLLMITSLAFSWQIAVVPDSRLERNRLLFPETQYKFTNWFFKDWWDDDRCKRWRILDQGLFRRYLYVPGTPVETEQRPPEHGIAHLLASPEPDEAIRFVDEIDISHRSLRYAWFEGSVFWPTSFAESSLNCSNFRKSKLQWAVFDGAKMNRTRFDEADLRKASFENVTSYDSKFEDSDLRGARLTRADFHGGFFGGAKIHETEAGLVRFFGTDLRRAKFHGAKMRSADFIGTDLRRAEFHGAEMENTEFLGADLYRAEFHGTNLKSSGFRGAMLDEAQFSGVDLTNAYIRAGDARKSNFYGSNMVRAEVTGTSLLGARFYGNDMSSIDLSFSDLRAISWTSPRNWHDVVQEIDEGLQGRDIDPRERQEILDEIGEHEGRMFHSHGLEGLDGRLDKENCLWTDRSGPFEHLSEPEAVCWGGLERYLVQIACIDDDPSVAAGLAAVVGSPVTWLEVNSAMALLETDRSMCGSITPEHRVAICDGLADWFGIDNEEGRNRKVPSDDILSAMMDRWNQANANNHCIPLSNASEG